MMMRKRKGNDGQASCQRRIRSAGVVLASSVTLLWIGLLIHLRPLVEKEISLGVEQINSRFDPPAPRSRKRGRGQQSSSKLFGEPVQDEYPSRLQVTTLDETSSTEEDAWQDILNGRVHLVDLAFDNQRADGTSYRGVYGLFCRISWSLHKKDPSSVPSFRALLEHSPDCNQRRIKVDLRLAVDRVREFDRLPNASTHSLNFTAAVFHESRCGSTLVANLLASMNPAQHRVYAESRPPVMALNVCGETYSWCPPSTAAQVFRDTLSLMQRSNDPQETRVFLKFQSAASHHISVFQQAFPDTPWLFVFRDPVQVMMSHIRDAKKNIRNAKCVSQQLHRPPAQVQAIVEQRLKTSAVGRIPPVDYCAAHLASFTEAAVAAIHGNDGSSIPVNYHDLPQALWEEILPHYLQVPTGPDELARMQACATHYSKGHRKDRTAITFRDDSKVKEGLANEEVRSAAELFLSESYRTLDRAAAVILGRKEPE
jgi:hypothetical protein